MYYYISFLKQPFWLKVYYQRTENKSVESEQDENNFTYEKYFHLNYLDYETLVENTT